MLQLEQVALRYDGGPEVLRDVNLTLRRGEFVYLTGASGAGKTSLLRVLALLQMPSAGRLTLFGDDVAQLRGERRAAIRRRIGMVFQDGRLLDHLSTFDNVALPLRINGGRDEQIRGCVSDMLKWLGLRDLIDARPTALSMGQRQLVSVARAVIARPSLLLCDEPTNNIDGKLAGQLMHLFAQLRRLGTTVVLATHSEDLVERYPHPVVSLAAGSLSGPVQPASALAAAD
ncbi:MAG TPA: ATP-binding cassette domain-containing protein [Geminicoccaceae bacterium]